MSVRKLLPAAAFGFVIAWLVGLFAAPSAPDQSDSAGKIAAFFAENAGASMVQTGLVDGLAGLLLAVFALAAVRAFRQARHDGFLPGLALGAGLFASLCSLTQLVIGETLAYRADNGNDAGNVKTLFTTLNDLDTVKLAGIALFVGTISVLGLRTAALPRWYGWAGLILAPALVLGGLAFPLESDGLYAALYLLLPALLAWVLALGILYLRSGERWSARERIEAAPAAA